MRRRDDRGRPRTGRPWVASGRGVEVGGEVSRWPSLAMDSADPAQLSGEAALQTSAHPGHAATAPDNPIRRRRIEFNISLQQTITSVTDLAATHPSTRKARASRTRR